MAKCDVCRPRMSQLELWTSLGLLLVFAAAVTPKPLRR
jgi:hypothetical protein